MIKLLSLVFLLFSVDDGDVLSAFGRATFSDVGLRFAPLDDGCAVDGSVTVDSVDFSFAGQTCPVGWWFVFSGGAHINGSTESNMPSLITFYMRTYNGLTFK